MTSSDRPALVTGATGFIGRRLVDRLLSAGLGVRALVLPGEAVPWGAAVEVVRGDVSDVASVRRAMAGAGLVFHLAAVVGDWGPAELFERVTVRGTANVLGAAADAGARAVLCSSVVVYGDAIGRDVCDEDHPHGRPVGSYSRSKQAQERIGRELERAGLALSIVRPTNVYGPGSGPWVTSVAAELRAGHPVLIGGGGQNAGLCHVEHAVEILYLAGTTPAAVGRAYNACDGSDVTWRRYFSDLARIIGAKPPRSLPRPIARGVALACEALWPLLRRPGRPPLTREALNLVGSNHRVPIARACAELGFAPRVSYEAGLAGIAEALASSQTRAAAASSSPPSATTSGASGAS